ncbi:flagellin [Polymorphum gilvum]|uniref:Flagellin n=1 Tax=Polymorphum gilvum (strain LMG 25793 / CGMCC 1.9160 / SL003B-26A1) TaxID=991905 RepID=F2J427_POLGS|nr:flagellin [Polymorphum gilvum]ADZ69953.1 Bacterial flagellin N-terminus domain protein [Polymorphum gilvum SL003B-26A1]
MSDIVLSSAVRENLLSLKNTASLMSTTQNRLATGLKVNTALDNPNSYFTAAGLNDRAKDLNNLLDNMGQAVQTIKAADNGITSITKLVESAKAIANQALQTQSEYERKVYAERYNDLLSQIETLARDASYKGKNLLAGAGNDLTVIFNEDSTSNLKIKPVDFTDTTLENGLALYDLATGSGATSSFSLAAGKTTLDLTGLQASSDLTDLADWANGDVVTITDGTTSKTFTVGSGPGQIRTVQDYVNAINSLGGLKASFDEGTDQITVVSGMASGLSLSISKDAAGGGNATNGGIGTGTTVLTTTAMTANATLTSSGGYQVGDVLRIVDGNGYEAAALEISETTTVDDLVKLINGVKGLKAGFSAGTISLIGDISFNLKSNNNDFNVGDLATTDGTVKLTAVDSDFKDDTDIERTLQAINAALATLRSTASSFGTMLSTVEIRQKFTGQLINTLEVGAGALTIADMNQEGANMLALQTRQQLSSTALSLANQAEQSVLSLFG